MTQRLVRVRYALFFILLGIGSGSLTAEEVTFNRHIRPILSENCYQCHGPDAEDRKAGLQLDDREAAIDYGAIEPGIPDDSLLIERVMSDDPDVVMPPAASHKTLTDEQKQLLNQWIAQGAEYESHWAFQPLAFDLPESTSDTTLSPLDAYVRQQLAAKGLKPTAAAPRERWLRRVTFDLTGLPPTLAELDAFLADASPEAEERVVDRLLASPAYGERMAAEWLDVARYSDTYGYQVDRDRFVWPWRDWVIRAFNRNLPYDQFITQQLAGDLLPNPTQEQMLATTFNRLHPQKVEGGSVEEEFRVEYVVDRAQTVSTAFMGLTFECARCHDHKFDPLTQKEFYEFNAFFANINEAGLYSFHTGSIPTPTLRLPTEQQKSDLAAAQQRVAKAEHVLSEAVANLNSTATGGAPTNGLRAADNGQVAATEVADEEAGAPSLAPIASINFDDESAKKLPVQLVEGVASQAALLSGDRGVGVGPAEFRRWCPFSVALWMQTPDVKDRAVVFHKSLGWTDAASRGYQLLLEEGKLSAALVHYWPGNAINIRTVQPIPTGKWLHVAMTYDGSSRADGLRLFIDGKLAEFQVMQDGLTKEITAGTSKQIEIGRRERDRGFKNGLVDGFEVYDRQLTVAEIRARAQRQPLARLLKQETLASLPPGHAQQLIAQHIDPACQAARQQLQTAREHRDKLLDQIKEIMVMRELAEPRETHVLHRGVYDARRQRVGPGTPAALPAMAETAPPNRLGLAQWLTSPDHPLTARVAVNRYWQLLFGRGLVATTEDFGSQGSLPTHPELLDWLASDFIESGWDVKQLLKTMVLSQTYRQDSDALPEQIAQDPENVWLARGPVAPLTAEMVRDSALAVSGLLSESVGGPPAKPYEVAVSFKPIAHDRGAGLYRRSLYTYWKRTAPAPVMLVLDASTRDVCRVRRERTSSPLQALVLLNGPQYVESARGAAGEVLASARQDSVDNELDEADRDAMIVTLYRKLTSRQPGEAERKVLCQLYERQYELFARDPAEANKYLSIGEAPVDESSDKLELAALSVIAQTVMNLDDYLVKR